MGQHCSFGRLVIVWFRGKPSFSSIPPHIHKFCVRNTLIPYDQSANYMPITSVKYELKRCVLLYSAALW
jgi:hypothetical protein